VHANQRSRLIGLGYLAPAIVFVLAFTAYPLGQMIWVSLNNWSLITPPTFIGLQNFTRAFADSQFWVSLVFTLKYTLFITPPLIIGGYLIALLVADNTRLRRFTRTIVFIPVVIGLGVSSLLWYWLFSTNFGFVNKILQDLHLITTPIIWKVIGFGMILFVGAIQAIPTEITEATMVDGASYWQRVGRVILPLTMRTILLVTLLSVIGSLLAFDQFFIMTAGQPGNLTATSVFYVYLNSFPYLKLGYGAALSLILAAIILAFTIVQMLITRRSQA
jgi:multiple sugar transport system permease protein